MENLTKTEIDYSIAKERVNQLKKFYANLAVFTIVFAVYNFRQFYLTGEITILSFDKWSGVFWIWGIILAVKALKLFFFNTSWERRMLDKELNK